ncbi:MAG: class I SAM-dependent methyltransferase [Opitutaceae bacterium]
MTPLLQSVADYYSDKVRTHGATPLGADWNSAEGQRLRFDTLLRIIPVNLSSVTLDEYGCGYGALFDHLRDTARQAVEYLGLDVSDSMIGAARARHHANAFRFHLAAVSPRVADFTVASGIFNVRLKASTAGWEEHIATTLEAMHAGSTRGFAFNCLSSYSDVHKRQTYLYYGDPCYYFDLCKRRFSGDVALLHDYGLYEFTLLVRKKRDL